MMTQENSKMSNEELYVPERGLGDLFVPINAKRAGIAKSIQYPNIVNYCASSQD